MARTNGASRRHVAGTSEFRYQSGKRRELPATALQDHVLCLADPALLSRVVHVQLKFPFAHFSRNLITLDRACHANVRKIVLVAVILENRSLFHC